MRSGLHIAHMAAGTIRFCFLMFLLNVLCFLKVKYWPAALTLIHNIDSIHSRSTEIERLYRILFRFIIVRFVTV